MHGYLLGLLKVALMSINCFKALACAVSPRRGGSLQKAQGDLSIRSARVACELG